MKMTFQIPELLFRQLKAAASDQGKSLQAFVNKAIAENLQRLDGSTAPAWRQGFGQLRYLGKETRRIEKVIAAEFSRVNPQERN